MAAVLARDSILVSQLRMVNEPQFVLNGGSASGQSLAGSFAHAYNLRALGGRLSIKEVRVSSSSVDPLPSKSAFRPARRMRR